MTKTPRAGRFLSLKWKLFILLSLIFLAIAVGTSWLTYQQQQEQLHAERLQISQRASHELTRQIISSQERLSRLAEYLVLLSTEDGSSRTQAKLAQGAKRYFDRLQLLWGLDTLQLHLANKPPLLALGDSDPKLSLVSQRSLASEAPAMGLDCSPECKVQAAVPVLLESGTASLGISSSIADLILDMRGISGWEIGIVTPSNADTPSQTATPEPDLQNWKLNVTALSNRDKLLPTLQEAARTIPFHGAGSYLIEQQGHFYDLTLEPIGLEGQAMNYWVILTDITESYAAIRYNSLRLLLATLATLFFCALFFTLVLHRPLKALKKISEALPMLAQHQFSQFRQLLDYRVKPSESLLRDEFDLLADGAYQLSDELDNLDREVRERTERLHRSTLELAEQHDFVAGILDNAQAAILLQDRFGRCQSINPFGRQLVGRGELQCLGNSFDSLFGPLRTQHTQQLQDVLDGKLNSYRHETTITDNKGLLRTLSWLHSRLRQQDRPDTILTIGSDITEQKQVQAQLQWLAHHDPLTQLPNRTGLQIALQSALVQAEKNQQSLAVLFCDLDHFKDVNDSLGHPTGDEVLIETAQRMRNVVRRPDTVARHGGDEFVILLEQLSAPSDAITVGQKILNCLGQSYHIGGKELFVGATLGIAHFPEHGTDATTLIKHADVAMYRAKTEGRNRYCTYSPEQSEPLRNRLDLATDLRYALQRSEMVLFYQPQLAPDGRTILGVEALIRWMHHEQGMIPPDRFIPLAEESGLIIDIGEWVLNEACRQLARWNNDGIKNISMAVNLAGAQITDSRLIPRIKHALKESGIKPELLELEITETFIMGNLDQTLRQLHAIKALGIELAIDDFGTGYSSLNYLKKLPVDRLKIDKSFVFDIGKEKDDEAIAKAIIALGHSLEMQITAEGVEDQHHVDFLRENGCDVLQGFLFSKPLPPDLCQAYLREHLLPNPQQETL